MTRAQLKATLNWCPQSETRGPVDRALRAGEGRRRRQAPSVPQNGEASRRHRACLQVQYGVEAILGAHPTGALPPAMGSTPEPCRLQFMRLRLERGCP